MFLRITHLQYYSRRKFTTISQELLSPLRSKLKLSEIPEVCTAQEWGNILMECREMLQAYPINYIPPTYDARFLNSKTVTQRIRDLSHRNNYLANTFTQLLDNSVENANELRWPGLITLMLSKVIGNPFEADDFVSKSFEDVIWSTQVNLAEIINLLYCNLLFRKECARLSATEKSTTKINTKQEIDRLVFAYFTSAVLYKTSTLSNCKVVQLLGDILESLATKGWPHQSNNDLMRNISHWEYNAFHLHGLILASGCQATLELAGFNEEVQKRSFDFGKYFAFAIKAHAEIQQLWNYQNSLSSSINISGFPIALHLHKHPETLCFFYNCNGTLDNLDTDMLNTILQSHSAMDDARLQLERYIQKTLNILHTLKKSSSSILVNLEKLIRTLNHIKQY